MAAYAALLSLSQTLDRYQSQDANYLFPIGAKEKIKSIHELVNFMLPFLEVYPEKAKRWEERIRDVAHEAEDFIEEFRWLRIQSHHTARVLPNIEEQLENVMEKFGLIAGEVLEERPVYPPASSSSSSRVAPTGSGAVIGLDDDIMEIKKRLCGDSLNLQVIPIVGMGGIGKTTLATTVYNDPFIMTRFDIRAWVVVSQDYTPNRFWKVLLDSMKLLKGEMSGDEIDESEIELEVFQNLKFRRYLLVIDDVWGTHVWDDVMRMFPDDKKGSRIMLTTRQLNVAAYPNSESPLHEMRFMNDSQSWDLLKQKVFANNNCPPELEDIGKEIARRCAGLPLAVVLVAGVLSAVNTTRDSWEEIARNVNPAVKSELEEILSFSYTHLPHHLRPCFLFIGGFPEDESIHASTLIKLWVAEGFLKHEKGCSKSLEEEAEEYLEDLVKRNLVLVAIRKTNGKIKSCNLHDAVRDLCIRKAHQEKFLRVRDGPDDLPQALMRRISFGHSDLNGICDPTIRTTMCFQLQNSRSWLAFLQSSRLLKVLNAVGSYPKEFGLPSQLFQLFHLTYLALIGSFNIPSDIFKLVNLQTLIIRPTFHRQRKRNLREYENASHFNLPSEIWRMRQLRHLLLYDLYTLHHPPESDGSDLLPLENLQTLSLIKNFVWNEKMVQMIPNAKKLGLVYSDDREYHLHHLKSLHQLEKLQVIGYKRFSWRGQNRTFPTTLKKLTLVGGGFPWESITTILGSLPNLEVLKLFDNACEGKTWEVADDDFPRLRFLQIDNSLLEQWTTQSSPFPRLQSLVLRSCKCLGEIPEAIGEIQTLEFIEVVGYCKRTLLESVERIEDCIRSFGNDAFQVKVHPIEPIEEPLVEPLVESAKKIEGNHEPPIIEEDNVVGFKDEAEKVVNLLAGGSDDLEVISIVGMPGLGKTTLASMIYRHQEIAEKFYKRAWVYVSQYYSRRKLFLNILSNFMQLTDAMYGMDDEYLAKELSKLLEKSKYLVVMDDVWTVKAWNDLKIAFPKNKKRSRILITSRTKKVARHANPNAEPHNLRFLTRDESWRLLQRKALGSENCPAALVKVGRHISDGCCGLPLAIVVIGGFLLERGTYWWWERIAGSVDECIAIDKARRMDSFIALSYNHLPYNLKECFLSFGILPKDFEIPVRKLFNFWIEKKILYNSEKECLEDLVNRNLVMVGQFGSDGKLKTCRIHDTLREFCKKKAAKENFFQEIRRFNQGTYASSNPALERYRRLSIHSRVLNYVRRKLMCWYTSEAHFRG